MYELIHTREVKRFRDMNVNHLRDCRKYIRCDFLRSIGLWVICNENNNGEGEE